MGRTRPVCLLWGWLLPEACPWLLCLPVSRGQAPCPCALSPAPSLWWKHCGSSGPLVQLGTISLHPELSALLSSFQSPCND